MVQQFVILIAVCLLVGCKLEADFQGSPRAASYSEKIEFFQGASSLIGTPYKFGGDGLSGIDCSGLVLNSLNRIRYYYFANVEGFTEDVTADDLYRYNTYNTTEPETGDLVFFDSNEDGNYEHVAIYSEISANGDLWVIDAYSVYGYVSHRVVESYKSKNPVFGELILYEPIVY